MRRGLVLLKINPGEGRYLHKSVHRKHKRRNRDEWETFTAIRPLIVSGAPADHRRTIGQRLW